MNGWRWVARSGPWTGGRPSRSSRPRVSDRLGWVGLQAVCYRAPPASELNPPAMTHHRLILFARPPEEFDLLYEGVKRRVPPPAGSIVVVPAGSPARYRWSGCMDTINLHLQAGAGQADGLEAFGHRNPARVDGPLLDGLEFPQLRDAMLTAVDAELAMGASRGHSGPSCRVRWPTSWR